MGYQSFHGQSGDSNSEEKFRRLRFLDFAGRRVLDVGCNEGFFCFQALTRGASYVVGIDREPAFIQAARTRAEQTGIPNTSLRFECATWDKLPDSSFDVILFLSALHYAEDQEALIHHLTDRLSPEGVLILECGIVADELPRFDKITRAIDDRSFPTWGMMKHILDRYAWKYVGSSVSQAGDPTPRGVFHIRKLKRTVILLLGKPYSGKTTLARSLGKLGVPTLTIDNYVNARVNQSDLDPRISGVIRAHLDGENLNRLYDRFDSEGISELVADDLAAQITKLNSPVAIVEGALNPDSAVRRHLLERLRYSGFYLWLADAF